ncbi:MAG: hypothetical protein ACRDQ7_23495 [Haloechinothrix sp.]
MRISAAQRQANENRIRAAIDRLLRGEIPADGGCDIKTLAREAGVDRAAFYGNRPYTHLRAEFEQRLAEQQRATGERPDPRDARIDRLKNEIAELKQRLAQATRTLDELDDFRTRALAQLAGQHDEIMRLRANTAAASQVTPLRRPATLLGSCN